MERILKLSNGLRVVFEQIPNTPRITTNFFIKSGVIDEKKAGEATLIAKLLFQGTKNLSAKQLADKIDLYAIDMLTDAKQDYLKIKSIALNEDVETALELMSDIIQNSTFNNFEKEITKLKGEILSDMDSAKTKALDNLINNLYENHPYGNTYTRILNDIDKINKEDVRNLYFSSLFAENCVISIVGDIEENKAVELLEKYFANIPQRLDKETSYQIPALNKPKTVIIKKDDVAQAQILKAWILPDITNSDIPALMVLNSILGSCGLSSRLFLELREKKGLAYVVRSSLDIMCLATSFWFYIATDPNNIKICLDGFKEEVEKLKHELVSEEELLGAKNNILGKRAFLHETTSQKCHYLGYYELCGLGAAFDKEIENKILAVTGEDIQRIVNKYLNDNCVISILAPEKYLDTL